MLWHVLAMLRISASSMNLRMSSIGLKEVDVTLTKMESRFWLLS